MSAEAAPAARPRVVREALVTGVRGSAPAEVGASMVLLDSGRFLGTVGGGRLEHAIQGAMRGFPEQPGWRQRTFTLGALEDQCCGGVVDVAIVEVPEHFACLYRDGASRLYAAENGQELRLAGGTAAGGTVVGEGWRTGLPDPAGRPLVLPAQGVFFLPAVCPPPLWIFGAGHVGRELARFAAGLDFAVTVFDDRPDWLDPSAFPGSVRLVEGWNPELPPGDGRSLSVAVLTYSHATDYALLEHFCHGQPAYLGVIASRSKAARFSRALARRGIRTPAFLHMPMGIPGLGKKPAEIAISVLAEILQQRHTVSGREGECHARAERRVSRS